MSIFGNLFGKNEGQNTQEQQPVQSAPMSTGALRTGNEVTLDLSKGGLLNLNPCSRRLGHGKFWWKYRP